MTPDEIRLVKTSFAQVVPISDAAATLFYDRLFAIAPELRTLFVNDLEEQKRKLMLTLATVVHDLDQPELVLPALRDLAHRHVRYGVLDAHYAPVGEALLWTLEQGLGKGFTTSVRAAWGEAYRVIAGAMIEAAPAG